MLLTHREHDVSQDVKSNERDHNPPCPDGHVVQFETEEDGCDSKDLSGVTNKPVNPIENGAPRGSRRTTKHRHKGLDKAQS